MNIKTTLGITALVLGGVAFPACSSDDDSNADPTADGGGGSSSGGSSGGSSSGTPTPENGGFQITVSGEDLAVNGYHFDPATAAADGDPASFVDGWEVRFQHVIVTIADVHLNADPDKDEGNPEDVGPVVASAAGPWAVDVSIGGPIVGKSGSPDEKTVAITAFNKQANGAAFDPAVRYAFGYELVTANAAATLVNLDAEGVALYEEAKTKGYTKIFQGTATYKGAAPAPGSTFAKIPKEVSFTLGLKNPSSYINCQNTDLTQLTGSDEYPRGVQPSATGVTNSQITIHTDHLFWSALDVEGTELHFDPIAAQASTYGTENAPPGVVTIEDLVDVDVLGFTARNGDILESRSLVTGYTATPGQLAFSPAGVQFAVANSFAGYLSYTEASSAHLNEVGECVIKNNFTP